MKFCKLFEKKSWKLKYYFCSDYVLNCVIIYLFFFLGFIFVKIFVCLRSFILLEKDRIVL